MPAIVLALVELAEAIYALVKIGAVLTILYALFVPGGNVHVANLVSNIIKGILGVASPLLTDVETQLAPIVSAFANSVQNNGAPIVEDLKAPLSNFAQRAFTAAQQSLEGKTNIAPTDWKGIASEAFADAAAFGLSSFAVSAAFEAAFPEKLNTLNSLGPMLATLSGFEEVSKAGLAPILYAGIAQPARYDSNSKFRSLLPNLMQAQVMYSRRKITQATFDQLAAYAGLSPDYVAPLTAASYRPLQPRALATAIQDTAFPTDEIRGILEDNALSPSDVNFYEGVLEYNALRNIRNSYITEALTAYGQGVVADSELDEILTNVGWSPDAKALAKSRALLQRRILLAKEVETQVTTLVAAGSMTSSAGEQQLEAAGIQPWLATLKITLASTKASVSALKKAEAAELKLELARQRNETKALISNYQSGTIDDAALTAGLVAIGLDPVLAGTIEAVQSALRAGRMRIVYGQLLNPEDAKVLSDRVDAISNQLKAAYLNTDQALAQLTALGVDQKQANALVAKWAASAATATPAGPFISPITGKAPS